MSEWVQVDASLALDMLTSVLQGFAADLEEAMKPREVVDYRLLTGFSGQPLAEQVASHMADGWELYEGPFTDADGDPRQAMVKYKETP